MDIEKIIQELNRRFDVPLPEYYNRRIIVWYDPEKEFWDSIDDLTLDDVLILKLNEANHFDIKQQIAFSDPEQNILLYEPNVYDSSKNYEDDWLLDVKLYSEDFRADIVSMWIAETGLPDTKAMRSAVKKYKNYFSAKDRRKKIAAFKPSPQTKNALAVAIMSAIAKEKESSSENVMKAVLKAGLDTETNPILLEYDRYELKNVFWKMVATMTGYDDVDADLEGFAEHLLISAASETMPESVIAPWHMDLEYAKFAYCYGLVSEWLHDDDRDDLKKIAVIVEENGSLVRRMEQCDVGALTQIEVFPCADAVILKKIMNDISVNIIDPEQITEIAEKRRTMAWYEDYHDYYEALEQVSAMQRFLGEHHEGFHLGNAKTLWETYTKDYFRMDTAYRLYIQKADAILKDYNEMLRDAFLSMTDVVDRMYTNGFLADLSENWTAACERDLKEHGEIAGVAKQTDFYEKHIRPRDGRVYVIISDALRYEVAVSLAKTLKQETRAEVDIQAMQGLFPTITPYGMAALLPHDHLSVKKGKSGRTVVLADGMSTDANDRDAILKSANPKSTALKYSDLIGMKRAERQEQWMGMDIIYIYHDTIDEAGHSEKNIADACESAINEIKTMIQIITNSHGGTNILITSDHGFLYTRKALNESDKGESLIHQNQIIEIGRRYLLTEKGADPKYLLPVKFDRLSDDIDAFAPRENIRLRMKGAKLNFVHGGVSLQEMVVPVIDYHFLRNENKKYRDNKAMFDLKPVIITLLSVKRTISNTRFSLNFFQPDPVSSTREAATYHLTFVDSNDIPVSDTVTIIADKTDADRTRRQYRQTFRLKPIPFDNTAIYQLVITRNTGEELSRMNFTIDISQPDEDIDFF